MKSLCTAMGTLRLSVCFFTVVMALLLGGCGQPPNARHGLPDATPRAVHRARGSTPTPTPVSAFVEAANPVRLVIPAIGVDAHIEVVGVQSNADLAIPVQSPWEDVGWYKSGPRPGERGSAVIDGHLDRPGGYPAVFWHLQNVHVGDKMMVIDALSRTVRFRITGIAYYSPQEAPIQQIFANENGTYLNLITCAGDWIVDQHQTTLRLVVFTSLD